MQAILQGIYDAGLSLTVRNAILIFGFLTLTFHAIWYARKMNESVWKSVLVLWAGNTLTLTCMAIFSAVHSGQNFFSLSFLTNLPNLPLTMLHGFIYFPIVSVPLARALKIDASKINDATAITAIFYQGWGHLGCIFTSCCYGYPSSFGVYNVFENCTVFPVQLFDALSCFLIGALLALYLKKKEYNAGGVLYPTMLLSYGFVRFIWEFARNNKKLWAGLSADSFHSIALMVVGAIGLYLVIIYNDKKMRRERMKEYHKKQGAGRRK